MKIIGFFRCIDFRCFYEHAFRIAYALCAYFNNINEIKLYLLPFFETSTCSFKSVEPAFKIYFPFFVQCIIVADMYSKQFILINIFKEAVLHYDLIELLTFTRTSRILQIYKNKKFDMNMYNSILDTNIFKKLQQIVI